MVGVVGVPVLFMGCFGWCEPIGIDMRLEMMDGVEGFIPEDGESAGSKSADEKRPDKARGMSDGNGVNIGSGDASVAKGLVDDGEDGFEVGAGGDFGDDASVSSKNVDLGDDDVAENMGAIFNDGGSGFVTGGFDGEDFHAIMILYFGVLGNVV